MESDSELKDPDHILGNSESQARVSQDVDDVTRIQLVLMTSFFFRSSQNIAGEIFPAW